MKTFKTNINFILAEIVVICLILLTPLSFTKYTYYPTLSIRLFIIQISSIFLLGLFLNLLTTENNIKIKKTPINYIFLIFIIFCGFSISFSPNKYLSLTELIRISALIFICLVIPNLTLNKNFSFVVLHSFILTANIISIFGIFEFMDFKFIRWHTATSGIISFQDNPIFVGEYISPILCMTFSLLIASKNLKQKILLLFSITLQIICLLLTSSRGPLLSFFISFFVLLLFYKYLYAIKSKDVFKYILIISIIFIFCFLYINISRKSSKRTFQLGERIISLTKKEDTGVEHRILMLKTGWEMVKEKPILGFGIGTFKIFYPLYRGRFMLEKKYSKFRLLDEYIHNEYIQFWIETGIVGFICFLLIPIFIFIEIFKKHNYEENKEKLPIIISFFTGIISIYISSFTCFPLHVSATAVLFFVSVGLTTSLLNPEESNFKISTQKNSIEKVFLKIILLIFILILCIKSFDIVNAYHSFKSGIYFRDRNKLKLSNSYFKKAEKLIPYDDEVLSEIAKNYIRLNDNKNTKNILLKIIKVYPYDEFALLNLSRIYLEERKFNEVLLYSKKGIEVNPSNTIFYLFLGNSYFNKNMYLKALNCYKKALEISPQESETSYNIGLAYKKLNKLNLAASYFLKAINIDKYSYYYINLGNTYIKLKEFSKAEECFTEASKLTKDLNEKHKIEEVLKELKEDK